MWIIFCTEIVSKVEGLDPKVKPVYFRFLTLLSFHVFLQEGVDAAVYETGVGKQLYCKACLASASKHLG